MQSSKKPEITGEHGSAWGIMPTVAGWGACIRLFYVQLDTYHPMLKWFVIACNHLREDMLLLPANKETPTKSHEFIVGIVDPESYLFEDFDPETQPVFKILPPLIVNYQADRLTDSQAQQIATHLATAMVDGQQIPEEETRKHWIDSIVNYNKWIDA